MEDKLIIKSIKRKNESGLEMLVNIYGGFIMAIIRQNSYNLGSYEDECMDDVLLSIWNNIDKYDQSKNSFKNWIASVTRYKVIDYKRKYIKILNEDEIGLHHLKDNLVVEENILKKELRMEIESLLDNLKPRDKELFIRHYLEEEELDYLSKDMGIKTEVLYNRLSRGRLKLRKLFVGKEF
ncbi:MAG: sigma-70 family RNA polymerase sigma factor [Clostridium sp.]